MKNLAVFLLLTLSVVSACSDDDTGKNEQDKIIPSVTLANVTPDSADPSQLQVAVTPKDAVKCAYVCLPEAQAVSDAGQIFAQGTNIEEFPTIVTVEDLAAETAYVFAVAVESESGDTAVQTLSHTTGVLMLPANTYIVSSAQTFRFKTQKVSGTPIENIASADWIWATKQSEDATGQELLENVSYDKDKGVIELTTTGKRGNAVIAAFDADGTVVWEWLIWCTEKPGEMEYKWGEVFLDRAIGATSADPADSYAAWGVILYQWGRLAPIFAGYIDEIDALGQTFDEARKWTVMNPDYPQFSWNVEKEPATVQEAIAAPTTFFAGSNWLVEEDRTLWGDTKTDYDPCPAGYRIPSSEQWGTLIDDLVVETGEEKTGAFYEYNGVKAYYPRQGHGRIFNTGENNVGVPGFTYWNNCYDFFDFYGAVASGQLTEEEAIAIGAAAYYATRCHKRWDAINPELSGSKISANTGFAHSVRCVKIK